jgi:hypothetical protein
MAQQRKLLDQVRDRIRREHHSYRTEKAYLLWIRRHILFHGQRYPKAMVTSIHTHVKNGGSRGVQSPPDVI